jgi:hypothetical protein
MAVSGYVSQQQIADEIDRVKHKLGPEVVRVRYTVGPDTSDEPAIHFRIVITDAASKREVLGRVVRGIEQTVLDGIHPYENWGVRCYFSYRNESEQASLPDPAWA